jgi:hypothetical protein
MTRAKPGYEKGFRCVSEHVARQSLLWRVSCILPDAAGTTSVTRRRDGAIAKRAVVIPQRGGASIGFRGIVGPGRVLL